MGRDTFKVFVYGTLKVGHMLANGLDAVRESCVPATCKGRLYHNGMYPFMRKSKDPVEIIHGEIHEYPMPVLHKLDLIEGYNPAHPERGLGYEREMVPVFENGGDLKPIVVWAYVWGKPIDHPKVTYIVSGRWKDEMSQVRKFHTQS